MYLEGGSKHMFGGQRTAVTVSSLYPPCGSWRVNSGLTKSWQQATLSTEPSHWPKTVMPQT